MRCKKHLPDLTSTIGVCASCLRERLQPIFAAQVQAQAQSSGNASHHREHKTKSEEEKPAPLNFPRSVSPYVAHRKSDCDLNREELFFGTPQVDAAADDGCAAAEKRRHGRRFWNLSNLFRPRSNKTEVSHQEPCEERTATTSSWFTTILPARRHHEGGTHRWRCRRGDRGLSPPTAANFGVETAQERSDSGNSTECSPQRPNPTPATAHRRRRFSSGGGAKGLTTSMAFCLSPLVRANPNRHWTHGNNNNNNNNTNKGLAQEKSAGGLHHISSGASFCANRSRKLADFGRVAHNR